MSRSLGLPVEFEPATSKLRDHEPFRAIAESVPHLVWTCLPDGLCDYLSPQWVAYTGIPEQEQLGYAWLECLHPEDRDRSFAAWQQAALQRTPLDVEFRIRRYDGAYRWFKTRAVPQRDDEGRLVRWVGTNTDIQELREAEARVQAAARELDMKVEARTRALAAAHEAERQTASQLLEAQRIAHVGSWRLAIGSGEVTFSDELYRIAGLDPGQPPPRFGDRETIFTPESCDRLHEAAQRCIAQGQSYELELEVVRPSGETRWTVLRGQAVRDEHGGITEMVGTLQDINELREVRDELLARTRMLESTNERLQQTAAQLRNALALNKSIVDAAGMAIFTTDAQGTVLSCNHAFERLTGYGAEEVVGSNAELFHVERAPRELEPGPLASSHPAAFAGWLHTLTTRSLLQGEWYYERKGGALVPVLLSLSALPVDDTPARYLGVAADLTEARRKDGELRRLSQRLHVATEGTGIGIWELDLAHDELYWNEQMARLHGAEPETPPRALSAGLEMIHPEDRARVETELGHATRERTALDTRYRVPLRDHSMRHLRAHGMVDLDEHGRARRFVGTCMDLTREVLAQQALASHTAMLGEFVAHAPAAIAMFDREMRYLQVSKRWSSDFGLDREAVLGRSHYELFPDLPQRWKDVHARVFQGAIERSDDDTFVRADGGVEWVQWEARPWRTQQGEVGGLMIFSLFVTARRALQEQLHAQKRELERSNEELQQFAYVASHDLQEPLRAVGGCAQILASKYRGQLDPAADELIAHITDGVARMRALILDLLALSRVSTREAPRASVDLNGVCRQALVNLDAAIRESGAELEVDSLPTVTGNAPQLGQLMQNLLSNAIKYRSDDRLLRIHIRYEALPSEHRISVHDNGIGIDPKYHQRIFVAFQRLHSRARYPGTGIGLAICNKVVQCHMGRMWVESEPGLGSTFYFSLPRGGSEHRA